jgi:23S rRNA pseudouridine1911/1915/1917 synthase
VYRRGTRHGIDFPRQALHAAELTLVHPASGETVTWRAAPPRDFKRLVEQLREDRWK